MFNFKHNLLMSAQGVERALERKQKQLSFEHSVLRSKEGKTDEEKVKAQQIEKELARVESAKAKLADLTESLNQME